MRYLLLFIFSVYSYACTGTPYSWQGSQPYYLEDGCHWEYQYDVENTTSNVTSSDIFRGNGYTYNSDEMNQYLNVASDGTSTSYKVYKVVFNQIPSSFECTASSSASICSNLGDGNLTYLSSYGNHTDTQCQVDGNIEFELSNTPNDTVDDYYGCFSFVASTPSVPDTNTTENNSTNTDGNSNTNNTDNNSSTTTDSGGDSTDTTNTGNGTGTDSNSDTSTSNNGDTSTSTNGGTTTTGTTGDNATNSNTDYTDILNQINDNISQNDTNMESALSGISSDINTSSERNHQDLDIIAGQLNQSNESLSSINEQMTNMNDFMRSGVNNTEASDSLTNAKNQATSTVNSITSSLNGIIASYTGTAPVVTGTGNHVFTTTVYDKTITFDLSMFENLRQYFDILWLLMIAYFNFKMYLLIIRDLLKKF